MARMFVPLDYGASDEGSLIERLSRPGSESVGVQPVSTIA